jgi:hypothetical protein
MSLKSSMRHLCIVDEITNKLIPGISYALFCCLSSTVGHGETCGVCELGLDGRGESRGDGVFTLACTPGKSLEPAFVIRTVPCNDTYLPTYLQLISTSEFSFGPRNWPLHNLFSTSPISAQFPLKRKDLRRPLSLILTPIIFCSHHLGPLHRASYTLNRSSVASVTNIGTPLALNESLKWPDLL